MTKLHAAQRGEQEVDEMAGQERAATKIQAVHRGKVARSYSGMSVAPAPMLEPEPDDNIIIVNEQIAAIKIQSVQRGKVERREMAGRKRAATRIQCRQRGKTKRKEIAGQKSAATRIQAVHRGKTSRAEMAAAQRSVGEQADVLEAENKEIERRLQLRIEELARLTKRIGSVEASIRGKKKVGTAVKKAGPRPPAQNFPRLPSKRASARNQGLYHREAERLAAKKIFLDAERARLVELELASMQPVSYRTSVHLPAISPFNSTPPAWQGPGVLATVGSPQPSESCVGAGKKSEKQRLVAEGRQRTLATSQKASVN